MNPKKLVVFVVAVISIALVFGSCKSDVASPPVGGMVTISLTGADFHDADFFYAGIYSLGETPPALLTQIDGITGTTGITAKIAGGAAADSTGTIAGGTYKLYGYIDIDNSSSLSPGDYITSAITITVNGNTTVNLLYTDFSDLTSPQPWN